jgi:hypothetical protein
LGNDFDYQESEKVTFKFTKNRLIAQLIKHQLLNESIYYNSSLMNIACLLNIITVQFNYNFEVEVSILDYQPTIYDNIFPDFSIMTPDTGKFAKYNRIIHEEIFVAGDLTKIFNEKFNHFWDLLSAQMEHVSFTNKQIISIKNFLQSKFYNTISDIILREIRQIILYLYVTKANQIALSLEPGGVLDVNYLKYQGKKEKKRVLKILLKHYAEYRLVGVVENQFLIPLSQAELMSDPISFYKHMLNKNKKFDRRKYPKDLFNKAIAIYSDCYLEKKITFEEALKNAIQYFPEVKSIPTDSIQFYLMNDAFRNWRSRINKKKSKK